MKSINIFPKKRTFLAYGFPYLGIFFNGAGGGAWLKNSNLFRITKKVYMVFILVVG
jgi:hypothetical protein